MQYVTNTKLAVVLLLTVRSHEYPGLMLIRSMSQAQYLVSKTNDSYSCLDSRKIRKSSEMKRTVKKSWRPCKVEQDSLIAYKNLCINV